jgi:hypothetical protein
MNTSIDELRIRLKQRAGRYREISRRFGVRYSWLSHFSQGLSQNPTLRNLQALSRALDALDDEGRREASPAPTPLRKPRIGAKGRDA